MNSTTTIRELLIQAKNDPTVLYRKYRAVYAAVLAAGNEEDKPEPLCELKNGPDYALFHDQPAEMMRYPVFRKFHGIDVEIAQLVNAIRQAQWGGELSGQIIGLEGPVGTSKSTFAYTIGRAMYARRFYAIKGCPWRENPLNAVPLEERDVRVIPETDLEKRRIASYFKTKQELRGELCSDCAKKLEALKKEEKDWQDIEVESCQYNFGAGRGLLRIELRNLVEMKNDRIPDEWFSALKCANGGVLFVNFEKVPTEFKCLVSGLVSEGFVNGPDLTEVSLDLVVVAIGNKSAKSTFDEAVKDRITGFCFPYPRRLKSLVAIGKEIQGFEPPKYHLMPHVNDAFYRLVAMSRQESGRGTLDIAPEERFIFQCGGIVFDKAKVAFASRTYAELKQGYPNDGSSVAISTRSAGKLLDDRYGECMTLENMLDLVRMASSDFETSVRERLKELMAFDKNSKGEYDKKAISGWYEDQVKLDLARAWLGPENFALQEQADFKYYLQHAVAYKTKTLVEIDDGTKKKKGPPDEVFLRSIEDQLVVTKSNEDKFRENVINFFSERMNHGIPECLSDLGPLQRGIRLNIMRGKKDQNMSVEDQIKAMFHPEATKSDPIKDKKNRDRVRKHLTELGYRDCCIAKLEGQAERILTT